MLAYLQQLTILALIAATTTWVFVFAQLEHPVVAIAGALLLVFANAFILALEMLLAARVNRDESVPQAKALTIVTAWWGETKSAARVFFWDQPFRSRAVPDRLTPSHPAGVGVVFVHGFFCNRGLWNPWLRQMSARGIPYIAVNLEPVFGAIDNYTLAIDAAVMQLAEATGSPPIIVAHSMGGLAVRAWSAAAGAHERVLHVFTLGTPHHGTLLARFAYATNAMQMRRGSAWLQSLARNEPVGAYRSFTCYFSHCDNIVMPASSATLPGADNRHLPGVAHVRMASDERVLRDILECVARGSRGRGKAC